MAALSGPNMAREIAAGLPAGTVIASEDAELAADLASVLGSDRFRVYTNPDLLGVELAGALKNVIALAAGFVDGLALGDSGKAAIITRGLAEITRLGVAAGAQPMTFAGLAGVGDLIATCMSPLSRNRRAGELMASGLSWADAADAPERRGRGCLHRPRRARAGRASTAWSCRSRSRWRRSCTAGAPPMQAVAELMSRAPKDELAG